MAQRTASTMWSLGVAFQVVSLIVSAMTAAHQARVGRTWLDDGYLPERGGKRRRMSLKSETGQKNFQFQGTEFFCDQLCCKQGPKDDHQVFVANPRHLFIFA